MQSRPASFRPKLTVVSDKSEANAGASKADDFESNDNLVFRCLDQLKDCLPPKLTVLSIVQSSN